MKYRKNVLNHLQNILLRHNVVIKPVISKDKKEVGKGETKDGASFLLEEVSSDRFTYKVKDGERKLDVKNRLYLETVRDILYFPNKAVNDKGEDVVVRSQKLRIRMKKKWTEIKTMIRSKMVTGKKAVIIKEENRRVKRRIPIVLLGIHLPESNWTKKCL